MTAIRNLSALVFLLTFLVTAPAGAERRDDCPQPLHGTCGVCEVDGRFYWYNACEETCIENEDICDDFCGNNEIGDQDQCVQEGQITCGSCDCDYDIHRGPSARRNSC